MAIQNYERRLAQLSKLQRIFEARIDYLGTCAHQIPFQLNREQWIPIHNENTLAAQNLLHNALAKSLLLRNLYSDQVYTTLPQDLVGFRYRDRAGALGQDPSLDVKRSAWCFEQLESNVIHS